MELIVGGLVGGALVYLVGAETAKNVAKAAIKTGYSMAGTMSSVAAEAYESAKDVVVESKAEFEAAEAARKEIHDPS